MSLPTIEPLPDENASLPPARRRRQRRMLVPAGSGERADFLRELALEIVPSFDFFLFSLLAGLVLAAGLLLDSPALFFLAALIAPFMAPAIGISLGTITGSPRFWLQSLCSLGMGSLIVFLTGTMAGWAATLLPERIYQQAAFYSRFSWPSFVVLALGASFSAYLLVRIPQHRPTVSSAAIAYGLYLPVGVTGFGLIHGTPGLWPDSMLLFFIHLVWVVLIGMIVLGALGLRPMQPLGYLAGVVYLAAGVAVLFLALQRPLAPPSIVAQQATEGTPTAGQQATTAPEEADSTPEVTAMVQPTATLAPSPTDTAVPPTFTPTRTLIPTRTPTLTITPQPTPVWARIAAEQGNGALVREEPNYSATVVQSVLNETLVEVLPEVIESEGVAWVHVRLVSGKEGWVVRSLLRTATPAPGW